MRRIASGIDISKTLTRAKKYEEKGEIESAFDAYTLVVQAIEASRNVLPKKVGIGLGAASGIVALAFLGSVLAPAALAGLAYFGSNYLFDQCLDVYYLNVYEEALEGKLRTKRIIK